MWEIKMIMHNITWNIGFTDINFFKWQLKKKQDSIMMIFLKNMMTTYQFDVLLNNFKFQKLQVVNINYLQTKSSEKHILNAFFNM
jgi:hypothetical protein